MKICLWCGKPLLKGRRKYCSDECRHRHFICEIAPLWWNNAMKMALERAEHRCEECGSLERLEVHHKIPLEAGDSYHNSIKNRQDNLMVLCRGCHEKAHHGIGVHPKILIPKEQLSLALNVEGE